MRRTAGDTAGKAAFEPEPRACSATGKVSRMSTNGLERVFPVGPATRLSGKSRRLNAASVQRLQYSA
jgi:hypothetical protein